MRSLHQISIFNNGFILKISNQTFISASIPFPAALISILWPYIGASNGCQEIGLFGIIQVPVIGDVKHGGKDAIETAGGLLAGNAQQS